MTSPVVASSSIDIGSTAVTPTRPAGAVTGDLLLAFQGADFGTAAQMTAPTGWTQIGVQDNGSGAMHLKAWTADGAVSSLAFAQGSGSSSVVLVCRITGQDPATPIVAAAGNQTTGTTTFNAPSVTPASSADLLLCAAIAETTAGTGVAITWTEPIPPMTHIDTAQAGANWTSLVGDYQALTSAAATGTRSFTVNTSSFWCALSVAVKPLGGAASVTAAKPIPRNRARFRAANW